LVQEVAFIAALQLSRDGLAGACFTSICGTSGARWYDKRNTLYQQQQQQ